MEIQRPQRNLGYITTTRGLLPFSRLEPTPLASKLIEHFKFLSSLYPLSLEVETKTSWHYPSSIGAKKSKKSFSIPP
jgi:hypothetical protein